MNIKGRKIYFDVMRILACGLVIFNHLPGYTLYEISSGPKQFLYMCLTMITRINVPLFFMISGALLLSKSEDFQMVFKKRISKIVLVMIIFEMLLYLMYFLNSLIHQGDYTSYSIGGFLLAFLSGSVPGAGAYWYLYSYLGLLFVLSFMQRIAQKFTKTEFIVLIFIHFLTSSLLPILNIIMSKAQLPGVSISSDFDIPFAYLKPFFYPLIGYYLDHKIDIKKFKAKHVTCLGLVGFLGIILSNMCTYYAGITTGTYTQGYVQLFDYLTAIVAFLLTKYLLVVKKTNISERKIGTLISYIGSLTLGIYLLDPFLKYILYGRYEAVVEPILPTLIVSMGWILISMSIGGIITSIFKKVPGLRKVM